MYVADVRLESLRAAEAFRSLQPRQGVQSTTELERNFDCKCKNLKRQNALLNDQDS